MNTGYVTICNDAYRGVLGVLLDSLAEFSDYPMEVFWLDETPPFEHERMILRRLVGTEPAVHTQSIWMAKIDAMIQKSFDFGVFIDADMIANRHVDELADLAVLNPRDYPLCAAHPFDPCNQAEVMEAFGVVTKSIPYGYGTFLFSPGCFGFFEDLREMRDECKAKSLEVPNADECLMNVLLWKMGAREQVNYYLPNPKQCAKSYMEGNPIPSGRPCGLTYHLWHGWKESDLDQAKELLDFLKTDQGFDSNPVKSKPAELLRPLPNPQ